MKTNFYFLLFLVCLSSLSFAQPLSIEGLWKGALIRSGNSVQLLEVQIQHKEDSLLSSLTIEDWPYYEPFVEPLRKEGDVFFLKTPYGDATLYLDTIYQELIGTINKGTPPINIHLKRMVGDKKIPLSKEEVEFNNGDFAFDGDLYYPQNITSKIPCMVIVSGRGCNTRLASEELAIFFARQGMATLAYDERGSKGTGYNCQLNTHTLKSGDLVQILKKLEGLKPFFSNQFGVFSTSAGAWTADAASLQTELDFMIQFVGPTTSIREQQFDGLKAFAETGEFDLAYLKDAQRYMELLYSKNITKTDYSELESLLKKAKQDGWISWLEDSDIPVSKERFNELWVQRFQFDPTEALEKYKGKLLCILGENDPIVPFQIQIDRLKSISQKKEGLSYEVKLVKEGNHGLGQAFKVRSFTYNEVLGSSPYYYKYYRAGVFPLIHATDFLKKHGFIKK